MLATRLFACCAASWIGMFGWCGCAMLLLGPVFMYCSRADMPVKPAAVPLFRLSKPAGVQAVAVCGPDNIALVGTGRGAIW